MKQIAVAQIAPILLNRRASIDKAISTVEEAAENGASLVVFPECFIPGYPTWSWRLRPGGDMGFYTDIHAKLLENSLDVTAGDLEPLCAAAKSCGITVSMGFNEREGDFSRATIFNSNVLISHEGEIRALCSGHRCLFGTNLG
jgi:nitrilase